ncbi:MAG: glycosyltransferase family 4 protein [Pseudomonadales bacterium]|nr:glycosyltransferase family 4 protein [Pseudomonadales bacterium]HMU90063.1 glycosyltransferase family 4 protein [Pseudomonadales bacterium]HMY96832.1 glycosyltransferase family 4 protein [Pseudomonadales bacterium]HMZ71723.1 glycosyltransferase family 4 protein [Pseudomonadales bacterium]HND27433.1 glycosyltransferase family 4 protein [Pseudomonadales bacterium]
MRILYASERPPYPCFLGGAARCAHRLMQSLSEEFAVDCAAVGSAEYAVTPWGHPPPEEHAALGIRSVAQPSGVIDCGYPVQLLPDFFDALESFIGRFRPDLIWAQLEGAQQVLMLARRLGIPGVLYVHDAETAPNELKAMGRLGCHVVCSSEFLANKVERIIGRPVQVVYPASDWYFGTLGDPQGSVLMINPVKVKGVETLLEIARRRPEVQFLLLESWKLGESALHSLQAQLAALPNVRFHPRVSDMRAIYQQARLLLVPSTWEEGFGMVAVEAQSCGIPVIASARGGLPESVAEGGLLIQNHLDIDAWLQALDRILDDPDQYRQWRQAALVHARSTRFTPRDCAQRFLAACRAPLPSMGAFARGRRWLLDRMLRQRG